MTASLASSLYPSAPLIIAIALCSGIQLVEALRDFFLTGRALAAADEQYQDSCSLPSTTTPPPTS